MENANAIEVRSLEILKYPRTAHLEGSRLQKGDEGYGQAPYSALAGRYIVVEEKIDGANSGVSFTSGAELLLQSRGHYLVGGGRERQFNLFKHWAAAHESRLLECLEDRYVMYGEFMHKLHSVFYDALPHLFCEFDVWDRSRECFLSTDARERLFAGVPVLGVPVLYAGIAPKRQSDLVAMLRPSLAKTPKWRESFERIVAREELDMARAWSHADKSDLAEGLPSRSRRTATPSPGTSGSGPTSSRRFWTARRTTPTSRSSRISWPTESTCTPPC
jgi:hypothetical protein